MLNVIASMKFFQRAKTLFWSQSGNVSIEFTLIVPSMILLVIGVVDIAKAAILYEEVYNAAHAIPVIASNLAVQSDQATSLTVTQTQEAMSAIFAEIPWIRSGQETGTRSVTLSSVQFLPLNNCTPSLTVTCTFGAFAAWSVGYNDTNATNFTKVLRPCAAGTTTPVITQTAPGGSTPGNFSQLPTASIVSPDPILVVDVHYKFTPIFFNFITGSIDFWASGLWPVRSVAPGSSLTQRYTTLTIDNTSIGAVKCTGFS